MKLILLLIFSAFSCCSFSQTETIKLTSKFFRNNYVIEYPKSWKTDTSKLMGADLFILSPLENAADKFSENINILIQDLAGQNIDLEKYKEITELQIKELVTDGKIIESLILNNGVQPCYKITYEMIQAELRLKITSLCYISSNKAYLITFSSTIDKYDQYKKIGENILNSFAFIK
jgi:hypothetical protein